MIRTSVGCQFIYHKIYLVVASTWGTPVGTSLPAALNITSQFSIRMIRFTPAALFHHIASVNEIVIYEVHVDYACHYLLLKKNVTIKNTKAKLCINYTVFYDPPAFSFPFLSLSLEGGNEQIFVVCGCGLWFLWFVVWVSEWMNKSICGLGEWMNEQMYLWFGCRSEWMNRCVVLVSEWMSVLLNDMLPSVARFTFYSSEAASIPGFAFDQVLAVKDRYPRIKGDWAEPI